MEPSICYSPFNVVGSRLFQLRERRFGDQGENAIDQREDHLCRGAAIRAAPTADRGEYSDIVAHL